MSTADAAERLRSAFAEEDPTLDVIAGCIASARRPPRPVDDVVASTVAGLDALATDADGADNAAALMEHLFAPGGFRGNQANYYDPNNSYLDVVLERHLGIPITLAVVAAEVGRRLGIELNLIGFPGHFLLGDGGDADVFFDPFGFGRRLRLDECGELLAKMFPGALLEPAHTRPLGPAGVANRMLGNLRQIHLSRGDLGPAADVTWLTLALPGATIDAHREGVELFRATGRIDYAAHALEALAGLDPNQRERHQRAAAVVRFGHN